MKIIDFIKQNADLDFIANLMVYPIKANDMGCRYELWNFHTINGERGMICCSYSKEEAIEEAKKYLNLEINGIKR